MLTVMTIEELEAAVRRDETMLHLEGEAKYFYEKKVGEAFGGGVVGALPGLLVAGPLGAVVGGVIGAAVSTSSTRTSESDLARFLIRYYRKSSSGVSYIELTHR